MKFHEGDFAGSLVLLDAELSDDLVDIHSLQFLEIG